MTWQWWVNQIISFFALILIVISCQKKTTIGITIYRGISTLLVLIGLCFYQNITGIIMCSAGVIRSILAIYFAYKQEIKTWIRWLCSGILISLIIAVSILFWEGYYSIIGMIFGVGLVITFTQKKAIRMRILTIIFEIFAVIYYALILSPMNVAVDGFALASAIVGFVRLDLVPYSKKKDKSDKIIKNVLRKSLD